MFRKATDFQKIFGLNDEFYSGEDIRNAIAEHFPLKDGLYIGLARITFDGRPFHADEPLDLEELIPDITPETEIPDPLPHRYSYGVVEGKPHTAGDASTFFIPTDCGYICDEKTS